MNYLIPAFTMLSLDSIYLSQIGAGLFGPMVNQIQNEKLTLNYYGATICYVLLLIVLYKFGEIIIFFLNVFVWIFFF